ncbi:MAG: hypothetical protein LC785_10880 [Acidobacteria bacterium]|nr:hypothetical protein [Acidobacteriota bacterium]MCA1642430.1 hypothetical protein [Acidobacteriota bacterium]
MARALAKAEIADAAWMLDPEWSKKLMREAYVLALPAEDERVRLRAAPVGAAPTPPSSTERARNEVRNRIMSVAMRDRAFADELAQLGTQLLGKSEGHSRYATLAERAFNAGDKDAASYYINQSILSEPTQLIAGFVILEIAARDRALADKLIVQYIEALRTTSLAVADRSLMRVRSMLFELMFPRANSAPPVSPPGPAAMRAYVGYVIESLNRMAQGDPVGLRRSRLFLLSAWEPLKQYAPELMPAFMELERLSRAPGQGGSLPTRASVDNAYKENYEKQIKESLDNNQPSESLIYASISRGDFAKARKLIDKLPDGAQKKQLLEAVDARESLALSAKGDAAGAEQLAERLQNASFILQVYPPLLKACVASKDEGCPARLVYRAVGQLKRADTTPIAPPAGIPASAVPANRELDRVLLSLSQLAAHVAPASDALALELLDEIVEAANRSESDTGQGRTGFDATVFRLLAAKNEARARQAAEGFKDGLRQTVALATIYRVKAEELSKTVEGSNKKKIDAAGGDAKPKP